MYHMYKIEYAAITSDYVIMRHQQTAHCVICHQVLGSCCWLYQTAYCMTYNQVFVFIVHIAKQLMRDMQSSVYSSVYSSG